MQYECTSKCVTSCAHASRKTYLWVAASAPPLPAVEQPGVVQQSSESGLAAAAAAVRPKLQGPEMRQQETRRRLAVEELEQTLRPLREQPEVLVQCPVARITLLAEAEEASKRGPAGLQRPAAYLPPAAEESTVAVVAAVVDRRQGGRYHPHWRRVFAPNWQDLDEERVQMLPPLTPHHICRCFRHHCHCCGPQRRQFYRKARQGHRDHALTTYYCFGFALLVLFDSNSGSACFVFMQPELM